MAQSVDRALTDDQARIAGLFVAGPKPFGTPTRKTRKVQVLDFITAQPSLIEMRKDSVAFAIESYSASEAAVLKKPGRDATLVLEIGVVSPNPGNF
jgi:hypothetical protein